MAEYGLTPRGPNPKRLDVILNEMHQFLTQNLGVNTQQNPQSLMNLLLTDVADKIAELWEYGEQVYHSQYPSTAEGISLDHAAEFGGSTREVQEKSYYHILCTGTDGTIVPTGTIIESNTRPATRLVLPADTPISRANFNKATVIFASPETTASLGIALNGALYTSTPDPQKSLSENLQALVDGITDQNFDIRVVDDSIVIEAKDKISSNVMVLTENLTTRTVSSVAVFATDEYGDIYLPEGIVTVIVKAVYGLDSVVNVGSYVAGRLGETDIEFRQSYADKIFNRSSTMVESIRSAILKNVQGVTSCSVYENPSHEVDEAGRWPHSVEAVVDGGDRAEIAQQILNSKAGGINTFGSVEVQVPGIYGENITIRFNRPTPVKVWFRVGCTLSKTTNPPTNYVDLIKDQIIAGVEALNAGDDVIPQQFLPKVPGIDYLDIKMAEPTEEDEKPSVYDQRTVEITERQRATTDENRIEVVIDG